jgi:hypothetical protein
LASGAERGDLSAGREASKAYTVGERVHKNACIAIQLIDKVLQGALESVPILHDIRNRAAKESRRVVHWVVLGDGIGEHWRVVAVDASARFDLSRCVELATFRAYDPSDKVGAGDAPVEPGMGVAESGFAECVLTGDEHVRVEVGIARIKEPIIAIAAGAKADIVIVARVCKLDGENV